MHDLALAVAALAMSAFGQQASPLLLRQPALSRTDVAFRFADDLWIVPRKGGDARRLTVGVGVEGSPFFSPDGSLVAFSGSYDGNIDVFVVSAGGGVPRRLTFHPSADVVRGWSPEGDVLFTSSRNSASRYMRLFTVSSTGGLPRQVPLPMAVQGCYSPDGTHMAYVPLSGAFQVWKRYRGGRASAVWIADLADSSIEKLPREDWNDFNPMWIGNRVWFLSDRDDHVTLYSWDTERRTVQREIEHAGFDIKWASAGPDAIAYEQFGSLHLFDLETRKSSPISVRVSGDLPSVRAHFEKVGKSLRHAALSPTGKRALFEARGEILTVPAEKGDIRNLTRTPGVAERDPAWSPDGKWIAYFSDAAGEYGLHLKEQTGLGETRKFDLGPKPSFYYEPVWSPDSKKIAFADKRLTLWLLDLESGERTRIDTTPYHIYSYPNFDAHWSPDSRWITYSRQLDSHFHAVFVYNVKEKRTRQVTDGLSDARFPVFDRGGKHLYFTASTDIGPTTGWGEMASLSRPVTRAVYVAVLGKDDPSPLAPESDEEEVKKPAEKDVATSEAAAKKPADAKAKGAAPEVRIDFAGLDQRILALPIPAANLAGLLAGKKGELYLFEGPPVSRMSGRRTLTAKKFELKRRKTTTITEGISAFDLSADASKALIRRGQSWSIVAAGAPVKPGQGTLKLDDMTVWVDPRAEWRQMYHETWRIQRDFLYDPNAHGLDLAACEKRYAPFLDRLASRSDLNYLFGEMLGNLVLGHTRAGGGDQPDVERVSGGLLGADYAVENGRYRFARIYHGENWNPQLRAPLTEPGVRVDEGDYLLAVNGRPVRATDNVFQSFENTAGKQVVLEVGPNADGSHSREVRVVPVASEATLRHRAWIDGNRRKVAELTGGRIGYVYLPDTAFGGFTSFNRYYYAQAGKQGIVIDERFNGGGLFANWVVDQLKRPLVNYWSTRDGKPFSTPAGQVFGPKVMIINESAGSGGDWMPWYFRRAGVGKLVGKRTWGGLVGIYGFPPLLDGGFVTAPNLAFWTPEGEWLIENVGVPPDIEVELDPKAWRQGRDPQLEKAVEVVLEELARNPPKKHQRPAFPDYYKGKQGR